MDLAALRALYDDEMRRRLIPPPGRRIDDDGVLVRVVGPTPHVLDHMVFLSRLTEGTADAAVAAEVDRARRGRHGLQWNVFDGDAPPDLADRLARAGLRVQARETVLARATDDPKVGAPPPDGVEVVRLTREDELREYLAVDEAVWGTAFSEWVTSWFRPALAGDADPVGIFLARAEGAPVGCGWVWLPRSRSFAYLFGGTVLPAHRLRGVYRALVAARARLAREHGFPWLATDANANSDPVLRRLGFLPIARRTEMVLEPPGGPPDARETPVPGQESPR